ncbi:MAG: oxidoreductase [bacterium]
MPPRRALVLGGSGLTGGHCLELLLQDDAWGQVSVLVRRPLSLTHPRLVQHQVRFDDLTEALAEIQADDVFCCLGTTIKKAGSREAFYQVDYTYPVEIAKLSLAGGATQFLLVSAMGANPDSSVFYNRVKGEVEQAIDPLGFRGFYIFRPSLLLGKRQERRPAEEIGQKLATGLSFGFVGPLKKYKPIEAKAVASAMVETARNQPLGKQIYQSHQIQAIHDGRAADDPVK